MPDVEMLSRIQFALTIMFHYLFPPLTIGLGVYMVIVETLWITTRDQMYKDMALFWTKLFAVNFAMGVATGVVMEFEFGTNWATYSRFVGDVFGSALAAEGIFAFFLESGFLAILVFGWNRVSPGMHYFSTLMVALGSIFSSIWIVIANSWQQTPAGYHLVKLSTGLVRAEVTDFWAMVFNPSSVYRIVHVWLAAFILGALFVLSIAAYYALQGMHLKFCKKTFDMGLVYFAVCSVLMLASGHFQACGVARYQPAKLAALEAHYKTGTGGTEMFIFGIPNDKTETVDAGLSIPDMLSFLVYEDPTKPVPGLDKFPKEDRPPVPIPFYSYHLMVGLGMGFIGLSVLGLFLNWRGLLLGQRWLLWIFVFAVLGGYAANETGWVAAEVGRQPWVVYGLLRTKDGVSHSVPAHYVLSSIIMFSFVYALLFWVWLFVLNDKIRHGPEGAARETPDDDPARKPEPIWRIAGSLLKGHHGNSLTETRTPSEIEPRQQDRDPDAGSNDVPPPTSGN
jgi:cytochrome d ubiquinol oxidase subunit I